MIAGERVRHSRYGPGVVIRASAGGILEVKFARSIEFILERNLVSLDKEQQAAREKREEAERADSAFKRSAENRKLAERRTAAKARVEFFWLRGDFALADAEYRGHCADWWPDAEYSRTRERALFAHEFAAAYPSSSLSGLDLLYQTQPIARALSAHEYAWLKGAKLNLRLARMGMPLSSEQVGVCSYPHQHRLIRARAGSGKTRTLAALAALTINDEQLNPDQVLILAFNTKAANEIGDRVRDAAGVTEYRNARTFHSLAWRLADHAGKQLIFDDGNLQPSRRKQSQFMERVLKNILNPAFQTKLYEFFRREIEQLDRLGFNLKPEEYHTFRRAMTDFTLAGENVKSHGEKFIADFFFEHGIEYVYEKVYSWQSKDRLQGSPYRPDFCLSVGGKDLVLEHWAIDPEDAGAEVPSFWRNTTTSEYREQMVAKRKFWSARGITLLETHAGMLRSGRQVFETRLRALLIEAGVRCLKLDHAILVRRVAEAPRTVSRISELFLGFISRAKKRGWTVDGVSKVIHEQPDSESRNRIFHELGVWAFAEYERLLQAESAMDFDDLLKAATEGVRKHGANAKFQLNGKASIAIRELRWIMIDEFQDFSELYYGLIDAVLAVNPEIRIVAVGDDWQAINGFAGAQLSFFDAFDSYFPAAGTVDISSNRRSGRVIVGAGNKVMEGRGGPALAHHEWDGMIAVRAVDKITVGSSEGDGLCEKAATVDYGDGKKGTSWDLAKALKGCVDFLVESTFQKDGAHLMPTVLVLARTSYAYGLSLTELGQRLRWILEQHPTLQDLANAIDIEVMTVHRAKGKEADTVIVLETTLRQFPKVHADNQLFGPFGVSIADTLAEERRLFYVAVTRAQHRLLLLTETGQESPYLEALELGGGSRHLAVLAEAGKREPEVMGGLAQAIHGHLDSIDRMNLIRNNVTSSAVPLFERLIAAGLGQPEVPYFLSDGLCAELAWPQAQPPVAVLTGRHRAQACAWEALGWTVHKAD
jgi:DNA helicase IV